MFGSTKHQHRLESRNAWTFLAFPVLIIVLFTAIPTVAGIVLSFFEWSGGGAPRFIGLKNYEALFGGSTTFSHALSNTLIFTVATVPITVVFAFLFAVALNAKWFVGRHFLRTVYFLPTIISIVAIGFIWRWILDPSDAGLLNHYAGAALRGVGRLFGSEAMARADLPEFLGNSPLGLTTIIVVSIWRTLGFSIVLYLATLVNVPQSYFEAAAVDGAGPWQTMRHITWPSVRPMTIFLVITSTISALQVFDIVLVMIGTNEQPWTDVLNLFLYREFTHNRLGFAAAIGVVLLALTVMITIGQLLFLRQPGRTTVLRGLRRGRG